MRFNICPLNPYIRKKALPFVKHDPPKKRIPLIERAKSALERRTISNGMAILFCDQQRFVLEGNDFVPTNNSESIEKRVVASLISHFGSMTENKKIIFMVQSFSSKEVIELEVLDQSENELLSMWFEVINNNYIDLRRLNSPNGGFGGKGLLALYNFAREVGVEEISYIPRDNNARAFYFYYDYVSEVLGSTFWLRIS